MNILEYLFLFLVFPGFLFSAAMGLIVGWIDRKVTARIQWRVGPPWYQNFADVCKLFLKETLVPENAPKAVFLGMPVVAMAAATLVSTILLVINGSPQKGFMGDLIVVVYLLITPSIALMLGGFSSGNPLASLGASREMKLMLAYELPFLISLVVPVMKAGCTIRLGDMLLYQYNNGSVIGSISGAISFLVMLLCVQAKLGFVPFDMAEAETEIAGGPYIEYSGRALAMFKLAKAIATFAMPIFLLTLYFGWMGPDAGSIIRYALGYILIVVLIVLIKNTNPRVRVDQALGFFWKPATALALSAAALAYVGL